MGNKGYSSEELNQLKTDLYQQFSYIKLRITKIYNHIKENGALQTVEDKIFIEGVSGYLSVCIQLFLLSPSAYSKCVYIKEKWLGSKNESVQMALLTDIFEIMKELDEKIERTFKECNVCKNKVFFMPIPKRYETLRKRYGFLYWNAEFQLESKEKFLCPICHSNDRTRLMIAFLESIHAEKSKKLRMLQIAPSVSLEQYALSRDDILYESTDLQMKNVTFQSDIQHMDMVLDETYDIIICSHVLEHVEDDARAMKELFRILKSDGVCLLLVPLVVGKADTDEEWGCSEEENWRRFSQNDHCRLYGKKDFICRLEKAGFYVNELGRDWFGDEFYQRYGFDDLSIMYVATKFRRLEEKDESISQEQMLTDLKQENRLLRQALTNLSNYVARQKKM